MLIFLDSHMEVTANWVQPLLEHVRDYPYAVAASIIDAMEEGDKYLSNGDLSVVTLLPRRLDFKW